MPPAAGTLVQDALSPQRNDRQKEDDEVQRRVVRAELPVALTELTRVISRQDVCLAPIPRTDAVDGRWHDRTLLTDTRGSRRCHPERTREGSASPGEGRRCF